MKQLKRLRNCIALLTLAILFVAFGKINVNAETYVKSSDITSEADLAKIYNYILDSSGNSYSVQISSAVWVACQNSISYEDHSTTKITLSDGKVWNPYYSYDETKQNFKVVLPNPGKTYNGKKVTSMKSMFTVKDYGEEYLTLASSFNELDVSLFETDNVTDMSNMFQGVKVFNDGPLTITFSGNSYYNVTKFNTSNVTNMSYMFYGCGAQYIKGFYNLNTAKVTDMSHTFDGCDKLIGISPYNNDYISRPGYNSETKTSIDNSFDTSNVTDMSYMYHGCKLLESVPLYYSDYFNTSKVENFASMFEGCEKLNYEEINKTNTYPETNRFDISKLNTSNATSVASMFEGCTGLEGSIYLNNLDTSNVTDMSCMFKGCTNLLYLSIATDTNLDKSQFDTSKVTNMSGFFDGCKELDQISGLKKFNTSCVLDFSYMFRGCTNLRKMDTSSFSAQRIGADSPNFASMFEGCSNLETLDLRGINIDSITSVTDMFKGTCANVEEKVFAIGKDTYSVYRLNDSTTTGIDNSKLEFEPLEFILRFDSNGGTGTMNQITGTKGSKTSISKVTFTAPAGMAFYKWEIDGIEYDDGAEYTFTKPDVKAKAVWKHVHNWDTSWSYDSVGHFHQCTNANCNIPDITKKDGYAVHTYGDWVVKTAATKDTVGSRECVCAVCGYVKSEVIPVTGTGQTPDASSSDGAGSTPAGQTNTGGIITQTGSDVKVGDTKEISNVSYTVIGVGGDASVAYKKLSDKKATSVTIPSTVTIDGVEYKVTEIYANAFKNNTKLKKVTIGVNIEKVGSKAFYKCKNLKTITIKTTKLTAKSVGKNAFKGIHKKAIIKVPIKQLKAYKKILKSRGINGSKQKIK